MSSISIAMAAEAGVFRVRLSGGAEVSLGLPEGALAEPLDNLPRLEVSGFSGARASLRAGFLGEAGQRLRVGCVEAPSDRFAPGVEELVLGVATGFFRRALSEDLVVLRLDAEAVVSRGGSFEQALSGAGLRGQTPISVVGRHVFGFEGEAREAVLCTVSCEEPRGGGLCAGLVARAELSSLVAPPAPSSFVRALLWSAERPRVAFSLGLLGVCLVVLALLARRPRPRP